MTIYRIDDSTPTVAATAFIADSATVIGDAHLGDRVSVWFGATVRADNEPITIGARSNVQEGAVLHVDPGYPMVIGEDVTIVHQAMLHGCTVGAGSLIGIQAVVLNGAVIGEGSLVGAGAIVTERKVFPPRSLILGAPAKLVRTLDEKDLARLAESAAAYADKCEQYRTRLVRIG